MIGKWWNASSAASTSPRRYQAQTCSDPFIATQLLSCFCLGILFQIVNNRADSFFYVNFCAPFPRKYYNLFYHCIYLFVFL
jgi:hypothetical protein